MYKVDTTESSGFEFEVDGQVYSVPRRESLPMPTFRKIRKRIAGAENKAEEAIDAMFDLFEEYAPGALDNLTFEQALKLVNAYTGDGDGEPLGESSTSSD